jgi:hypothetical protein
LISERLSGLKLWRNLMQYSYGTVKCCLILEIHDKFIWNKF